MPCDGRATRPQLLPGLGDASVLRGRGQGGARDDRSRSVLEQALGRRRKSRVHAPHGRAGRVVGLFDDLRQPAVRHEQQVRRTDSRLACPVRGGARGPRLGGDRARPRRHQHVALEDERLWQGRGRMLPVRHAPKVPGQRQAGGKGAPMSCAMVYWGRRPMRFSGVFIGYGAVAELSRLKGVDIGMRGASGMAARRRAGPSGGRTRRGRAPVQAEGRLLGGRAARAPPSNGSAPRGCRGGS